jgi:hypothetical protein
VVSVAALAVPRHAHELFMTTTTTTEPSTELWATSQHELLHTLSKRNDLKQRVVQLVNSERILEAQLETPNRIAQFRKLFVQFVQGRGTETQIAALLEMRLPAEEAVYGRSGSVFPPNWGAALLQRQGLRFYNHAVLTTLIQRQQHCVRVSDFEMIYSARDLLEELNDRFGRGMRVEGILSAGRVVTPAQSSSSVALPVPSTEIRPSFF